MSRILLVFPLINLAFAYTLNLESYPIEPTCTVSINPADESMVVWEDFKHDLRTYFLLSQPRHAGLSCKGLDPMWGFCGFVAGDAVSKMLKVDDELRQDCPLGYLTIVVFNRAFLLVDERYSSLFHMWTMLTETLSSREIGGWAGALDSRAVPGRASWPIFGGLARLQETVRLQEDFVSDCDRLDDGEDLNRAVLARALLKRVESSQRLGKLGWRIMAQNLFFSSGAKKPAKCPLGEAAALAGLSWAAQEWGFGSWQAEWVRRYLEIREEGFLGGSVNRVKLASLAEELVPRLGLDLPVGGGEASEEAEEEADTGFFNSEEASSSSSSAAEGNSKHLHLRLRMITVVERLVASFPSTFYRAYDVLASRWPVFALLQRFDEPYASLSSFSITEERAVTLALDLSPFTNTQQNPTLIPLSLSLPDSSIADISLSPAADASLAGFPPSLEVHNLFALDGAPNALLHELQGGESAFQIKQLPRDHDHHSVLLMQQLATDLSSETSSSNAELSNADLVPLIRRASNDFRPLVFSMNHGFVYSDPAMVDFPVDLIYQDLRTTLKRVFGMRAVHQPSDSLTAMRARDSRGDQWDLNFVYVSNLESNLVEVGLEKGEEDQANVSPEDVGMVDASSVSPEGDSSSGLDGKREEDLLRNEGVSEEESFYSRKANRARARKKVSKQQEKLVKSSRAKGAKVGGAEMGDEHEAFYARKAVRTRPPQRAVTSRNRVRKTTTPADTTTPVTTSSANMSSTADEKPSRTFRYAPLKSGWRLRQLPHAHQTTISHTIVGRLSEKDAQCRLLRRFHKKHLTTFPASLLAAGSYPPCFLLPDHEEELWEFSSLVQNAVYIRKPGASWGGRGIELSRSLHHLTARSRQEQYERLENRQCYGLAFVEGVEEVQSCELACVDRQRMGFENPCGAWSFRPGDGCWITEDEEVSCGGNPSETTMGWISGRKFTGQALKETRSVVQLYIEGPTLGRIGQVRPLDTGEIAIVDSVVKTDVRVQGNQSKFL